MKDFAVRIVVSALVFAFLTPVCALADLVDGTTVKQDVIYATAGGTPLPLDLYLPASKQPVPLVIWIHGGGWVNGDKKMVRGVPLMPMLLKAGIGVASIDYRFSNVAQFPAQLYDCKAAVRWLRAHAAENDIDPKRIAAAGDSAGGHLVALLGTTADHPELEGDEGNPGVSSAICAVCDFFGPTDFVHWNVGNPHPTAMEDPNDPIAHLIGGTISDNPDKAAAASPITYVSAKACPFYILHGDADTVVPLAQSAELNLTLQRSGVNSTLYIVKGGGHEFKDPAAFQHAFDFLKHELLGP